MLPQSNETLQANHLSLYWHQGLDSEKIIEGYRYIASKHRNRDIHYYVKNIRDDHFCEVGEIFVPCFNILIGVVPDQASVASALLA